jgi:hypothetical protein
MSSVPAKVAAAATFSANVAVNCDDDDENVGCFTLGANAFTDDMTSTNAYRHV